MPSRIKICVSGNVQGVGYRYYTYRTARRLSLSGSVKNKSDGSVEIIAEGDKSKLLSLLEELRIGPPGSNVQNLDIKWEDPTNEFIDFKILR
ncbi:MAG: acylphosphatase [Candidatus Methanomethylicus sp.]|nr:acylphosphatase [Candidatus Methanomethylicus sp.]